MKFVPDLFRSIIGQTNEKLDRERILKINVPFDLQVNLFMNHLASTLTKLEVIGVKSQVNEFEKADFHVKIKAYLLKSTNSF